MKPLTDNELLERFTKVEEAWAFEQLVERHLGFVLSAARRRLPGHPLLAEEVAQNVFVILARKAGSLQKHPCLPAWLQKTATHEAMRAARKESNHLKKMKRWREESEIESHAVDGGSGLVEEALPLLDEAIAVLGESDRRTLLMRFYEGKSFKAISAQLGKNEAACQKQARRAVGKLADLLRGRGVAISATVLATGLGSELAKAAPVAMCQSVARAALGQAAAGASVGVGFFPLISVWSEKE